MGLFSTGVKPDIYPVATFTLLEFLLTFWGFRQVLTSLASVKDDLLNLVQLIQGDINLLPLICGMLPSRHDASKEPFSSSAFTTVHGAEELS